MLDKLNRVNVLYDIYGPLLTERQQEVLRFYFSDDLSLGEIGSELGVSRQAVYDIIRRSLSAMDSLDKRLGLYNLFHFQQACLLEADAILQKDQLSAPDQRRLREIIAELRQKNEQ